MKQAVLFVAAFAGLVSMAGCGTTGVTPTVTPPYVPPTGNYAGTAFAGKVLAGGTPVIGASVQIYAAGTAGNGSAPTQLLGSALTTDSNGSFTVSAGYTCPLSTSILYMVATGGHAGAAGATIAATELMSSPGPCSAVTASASYVIDELTTVASAYAFAQFLSAGAQLGATSTNSSGITLAAATLANLVNITTGTGQGGAFPATGTSPIAKLNLLANALNACIVSSGAGSSACTSLLSAAAVSGTPPTDTLDAVLNLVKNPGTNVSPVYTLSKASSAYMPVPAAAPVDWVLFVTYTGAGMNDPSAVSIDSKGNVWVANYFAVASLFSNTGTPVYGTGLTSGSLGLGYDYGGTVDANDVMWFANEPSGPNSYASSVSLVTSAGAAVSGAPYTSGGLNFPIAVSVDQTNVSWVVDYGNSHLTLLSNAGAPLSGTSGFNGVDSTGTGNFIFPVAVAVDSNRNGWVANQSSNTVTKVAPDGSSYKSYACCDGASGVSVDAGNNVWIANYYGDSVGLVSAAGSILSGSTGFQGGGIFHPQGIAADGAGTVWVANYRGPSISELAGVGAKAGAGAILSPSTGWAPDANLLEAFALAIDASGNLWVTNFGSNTLVEFVGLAAPVKTPLLGSVRVP